MSKKIVLEIQNIWQNESDIIVKVKRTLKQLRCTDNLTILKYLYKNYNYYPIDFIVYLLMTMEENAITGIHIVNGLEYSNSDLLFHVTTSTV